MNGNKLVAALFLFVFFVINFNLLFPCPKNCPRCWQKFKQSQQSIILPFEKETNNTYIISLNNLRTEIEKARIGDKLIVELKLGKEKAIKIGTFSPLVIRLETKIPEKYNSMGKVSFKLPEGVKVIPTSGLLVVKDVSGKFKSSKLVQLKVGH